jgi:hypothetical protein
VTSTSGYPRDWAAYHECGHAVAYWSLGLPYEYVTLSSPSRLQPLRTGTISTVAEKWLYSVAGIIADYQHRGLIMEDAQIGILLTGAAGQYELADPSTRLAVTRPSRAKAVGPGGPGGVGRSPHSECWPVKYCASIWRECELYVKGLAPAIDAVARKFLQIGTITQAEVSAAARSAMREIPEPVIPGWAVRDQCRNDWSCQASSCE